MESLDVERLRVTLDINNPVYTNYARRAHVGPYIGDCYDAVVVVHDDEQGRGLVLGNEAPSVLKRTTTFLDGARNDRPDAQGAELSFPKMVEAGGELGKHLVVHLPLRQLPPA